MNGKEQVELLIESLELRHKQVKENKELYTHILIYTPCPLCKTMGLESLFDKDGEKKCAKCIAHVSNVCADYADKVLFNDRTKLLKWLRYQIKKWKKIQLSADFARKKLEQWKMDEE